MVQKQDGPCFVWFSNGLAHQKTELLASLDCFIYTVGAQIPNWENQSTFKTELFKFHAQTTMRGTMSSNNKN